VSVILSNAKDLGRDSSLRYAVFRMTEYKMENLNSYSQYTVRQTEIPDWDCHFFCSIACLTISSTGFISIHSGFHMMMYFVPSRRRIMG